MRTNNSIFNIVPNGWGICGGMIVPINNKIKKMKLFGLALYMGNWPAFCFGKKAWVCKIIWSPVKHKFCWFHFSLTSEEVWRQRANSDPYKFFGIMILPKENIYDLND